MVYWGCGTSKNRCIWALFTLSAVAGSVLIIAGAARLDICSKLPVYVHISGACAAAPRAVTVIGVFVLLATIPCVLFFSGCARGPSQTKYPTEGVPASGVTVVKHSANGPQVYQYDSHGRLIAAPDCTKHTKHAQQYVLPTTPVKAAAALSTHSPHTPSSKNVSSKPGGENSPAATPRHPVDVRAYGSETGDTATAEVHVSVLGPLVAGRAAQLQQQLAQLAAQGQEQRQQQEQQHKQDQDQHQDMHR